MRCLHGPWLKELAHLGKLKVVIRDWLSRADQPKSTDRADTEPAGCRHSIDLSPTSTVVWQGTPPWILRGECEPVNVIANPDPKFELEHLILKLPPRASTTYDHVCCDCKSDANSAFHFSLQNRPRAKKVTVMFWTSRPGEPWYQMRLEHIWHTPSYSQDQRPGYATWLLGFTSVEHRSSWGLSLLERSIDCRRETRNGITIPSNGSLSIRSRMHVSPQRDP